MIYLIGNKKKLFYSVLYLKLYSLSLPTKKKKKKKNKS